MRIDKFLVECGIGSRKEVKELLQSRKILKNGFYITSPKEQINPMQDTIQYGESTLVYKEFRYYILYKRAGYVTALDDPREKTVMEFLPDWVIQKDLAPVGRLDKGTEGLLLFTNDGKLNHSLLSPKQHVEKEYEVILAEAITEEAIDKLRQGVDIGDYVTQAAEVIKKEEKKILLIIHEGKFHQVKRMLEAVGNHVLHLKRVRFGALTLGNMELGEVREISKEEIFGEE